MERTYTISGSPKDRHASNVTFSAGAAWNYPDTQSNPPLPMVRGTEASFRAACSTARSAAAGSAK
jgi:hypothetical protein